MGKERNKKLDRRKFLKGVSSLALASSLGYLVGKTQAQTSSITIEPRSFQTEASYIISKDGSAIYARDGNTGQVQIFNDAFNAFKTIESLVAENSKISVKNGDYVFSQKWVPTKKLRLHGEGDGTRLLTSGSYDAIDPTNLALFDIVYQTADGVLHSASFDPNVFGDILAEMLREEVGRGIYDEYWKVLGPTVGTDYSVGVGSPVLVQCPEGGPIYFLFTGWKDANATYREVFIGEIDENFNITNIRKLIASGEPSSDVLGHHTPSVVWDAYNEQWIIMIAEIKSAGNSVSFFRYNKDFTQRLYSASNVLLSGSSWSPDTLSIFRRMSKELFVTYYLSSSKELRFAYSSDFTAQLPTFNAGHRLVPNLEATGSMAVGVGIDVHHSIMHKDMYITLAEMSRQGRWNIYPIYWYDFNVCGLIGKGAIIQPFQSDDIFNVGHPFLTWLPNRKLNLFFTRFPAYAPSMAHEIWCTQIKPNSLDIKKQSMLVAVPWQGDSISAGSNSTYFPFFGEKKTIIFSSNVSGDLTIEVDPVGMGNWTTFYTASNVTSVIYQTTYSAYLARLKFSQAATVNAYIILEP
jgi:hypothetical protein